MRSTQWLDAHRVGYIIKSYSLSAGTASKAADEMGCSLDQMYKTLLLRSVDHRYFLILIPETQRLDLLKVAKELGVKVHMAPKEAVEEQTGYQVGSVSPFGIGTGRFASSRPVLIDKSCLSKERIGVGSGEFGKELFLKPQDLIRALNPKVGDFVLEEFPGAGS